MSEEEWQVFTRFIRSAVPNWQRIGLLPRTQDPLDLTPMDVMNRYRRWAELERLRLDPSIPWLDGQSLGALLKTCGDRLSYVQAALRKAGIELPEEWGRPVTTDLLPKRQRALCRECETDTFGPPEKYTFQNWPASTCPRSRKYHRKQAAMRQSGTTTYRDGKAVRDAPAGERRPEAVNVTLDRDVPGGERR